MNRLWKLMLTLGILLLIAVMIGLPILISQAATVEGIDYIDTPLEWFAERYCGFMFGGNLWIWLLAVGIVLIVATLWVRLVQKKK